MCLHLVYIEADSFVCVCVCERESVCVRVYVCIYLL